MQRFGEKLRILRQQRGLSYRKLASQLGVVHSHLAGIEANTHKPSAELVLKIAKFFEVSTDKLMDDELELDEGHK
jgi:transcriptional regulator with XRE-family HTH domain